MPHSTTSGTLRFTTPLVPVLLGFASSVMPATGATVLLDTSSLFSGGQVIGSASAGVGLPPPPSASRVSPIPMSVAPTIPAPSQPVSQPSQPAQAVSQPSMAESEPSAASARSTSSDRAVRSGRRETTPSTPRRAGERRVSPSPSATRPSTPSSTPYVPTAPAAPLPSGKEPFIDMPAAPTSNWLVTLDSAWLSDFYFRGLKVLDRVSPTDTDNGVWRNSLEGTYFWGKNAVKFGFGYIYSLNDQLPNGDSAEFSRRSNPDFRKLEEFEIAPTDRYTELNFAASYSRQFLENDRGQAFLGTLGLAHYRFSNPQFWNSGSGPIRDTTEIQAGLAYIGLGGANDEGTVSWSLQPALSYAYDFDNFEGHFLEFGLTSEITIEPLKLRIAPRVAVSYDIAYNGPDNGWNNVETSIAFSRPLNKYLTLNLIGGYNFDLGDQTADGRRTDSGYFGGVTISALLGPWAATEAPAPGYTSGKEVYIPEPATRNRWSFSAGAGYREIDASFRSKRINPYDALGLAKRKNGRGDLGVGAGKKYLDGEVGSDWPAVDQNDEIIGSTGTSWDDETFGGQIVGNFNDGNRQAIYRSERYAYRGTSEAFRQTSKDDDELFFPYVKLSYDFIDTPTFAAGFGVQYAYSRADLDSGLSPVTFSQGFEQLSAFGFVYDFDNYFGDGSVIHDPVAFGDFLAISEDFGHIVTPAIIEALKARQPQTTRQDVENEIVRVAGFLQTKLDVKMHEITFPVSFTYKPSKRFELSLSAGPTLNLFDLELDSTLHIQQLENLGGGRTLKDQRGFLSRGIKYGQQVQLVDSGTGTAPATAPNEAATTGAAATGGKGSLNTTHPRLPGRTVAVRRSRTSDQHLTWGLFGQGTLTVYLDERQTWALDFWGRYNYVDPFTVSNDFASAEIDASSWSAGVGIVYRF